MKRCGWRSSIKAVIERLWWKFKLFLGKKRFILWGSIILFPSELTDDYVETQSVRDINIGCLTNINMRDKKRIMTNLPSRSHEKPLWGNLLMNICAQYKRDIIKKMLTVFWLSSFAIPSFPGSHADSEAKKTKHNTRNQRALCVVSQRTELSAITKTNGLSPLW